MVVKPDGTFRLIIDLKPLNAFLADRRLRKETLRDLEFNLQKGD